MPLEFATVVLSEICNLFPSHKFWTFTYIVYKPKRYIRNYNFQLVSITFKIVNKGNVLMTFLLTESISIE